MREQLRHAKVNKRALFFSFLQYSLMIGFVVHETIHVFRLLD